MQLSASTFPLDSLLTPPAPGAVPVTTNGGGTAVSPDAFSDLLPTNAAAQPASTAAIQPSAALNPPPAAPAVSGVLAAAVESAAVVITTMPAAQAPAARVPLMVAERPVTTVEGKPAASEPPAAGLDESELPIDSTTVEPASTTTPRSSAKGVSPADATAAWMSAVWAQLAPNNEPQLVGVEIATDGARVEEGETVIPSTGGSSRVSQPADAPTSPTVQAPGGAGPSARVAVGSQGASTRTDAPVAGSAPMPGFAAAKPGVAAKLSGKSASAEATPTIPSGDEDGLVLRSQTLDTPVVAPSAGLSRSDTSVTTENLSRGAETTVASGGQAPRVRTAQGAVVSSDVEITGRRELTAPTMAARAPSAPMTAEDGLSFTVTSEPTAGTAATAAPTASVSGSNSTSASPQTEPATAGAAVRPRVGDLAFPSANPALVATADRRIQGRSIFATHSTGAIASSPRSTLAGGTGVVTSVGELRTALRSEGTTVILPQDVATPPSDARVAPSAETTVMAGPDGIAPDLRSESSAAAETRAPAATSPEIAGEGRLTSAATSTLRDEAIPEKIAARSARSANLAQRRGSEEQKQTLASRNQGLVGYSSRIGINAAPSDPAMPMPAHAAPSLASPELVPAPAGAASFDGMTPDTPPAAVDLPRAAHRAVDSAMMMADHYAEGAKRGVSLQFSVSGVDLSVRVEMRHDGVHTFFRTDSTELRDAIAQEWQSAMATQPQERSSRLAEPVFTHQSGASTTADSGANSYREPGRRQEQPAPAAERFVPPTARTAAAAPTPKAPAPRVVPLSTALHLHTFA